MLLMASTECASQPALVPQVVANLTPKISAQDLKATNVAQRVHAMAEEVLALLRLTVGLL